MTAQEFIQSGLIETYCLGFTNREEELLVQQMADAYPEVKAEIKKVRESFNTILHTRKIEPSPSVKKTVMNTIYIQQSVLKKEWVPLMHEPTDFNRYYEAASANKLTRPVVPYDNIFVQELPSTKEVTNFAIWAKQGHEEETHNDMNEYIAILEGSCDMYMNGKITAYTKGQVIAIYPHIPHHAVVTSEHPMFALVQRQLAS
jgi:quercetin dioxygenase-like cupin family protein